MLFIGLSDGTLRDVVGVGVGALDEDVSGVSNEARLVVGCLPMVSDL